MIPTEFDDRGTGALFVEDPRDYPIADLFASAGLPEPAPLPPSYRVAGMGPVLDQGSSPKCVAYSGSALKAQQDRVDQGVSFNFDESKFFSQIGGTAAGAFIGSALERLVDHGYPVVGAGDAGSHRIAAYYRAGSGAGDLKAAIHAFGPIWVIGQWFSEWHHPGAGGVLPSPVHATNGHAVVLYGWDARGFIGRNSWGSDYGAGGDFVLRYAHLGAYLWAAYKTVDRLTFYTKTVGCRASFRSAPGASGKLVGKPRAGAKLRVRPLVPGIDWKATCASASIGSGRRWYPVATIDGRAVSAIYPGHELVYFKRGATREG